MGKSIVIKKAHFSTVSVKAVNFITQSELDITSEFSFTDGYGWIANVNNEFFGLRVQSPSAKYKASNKIDISNYDKLTFVSMLVQSSTNSNGYLFFDQNDNPLTEGAYFSSSENADGYVTKTVIIPDGAKYFATTMFSDTYLEGTFNCIAELL